MHGNTCTDCNDVRRLQDNNRKMNGWFLVWLVLWLLSMAAVFAVLLTNALSHQANISPSQVGLLEVLLVPFFIFITGTIVSQKKAHSFRQPLMLLMEKDGEPHLHLATADRTGLFESLFLQMQDSTFPEHAYLHKGEPVEPFGRCWMIVIVDPFSQIRFTDELGQTLVWRPTSPFTLLELLELVKMHKTVDQVLDLFRALHKERASILQSLSSSSANERAIEGSLHALSQVLLELKTRKGVRELAIVRGILEQLAASCKSEPDERVIKSYRDMYRAKFVPAPTDVVLK